MLRGRGRELVEERPELRPVRVVGPLRGEPGGLRLELQPDLGEAGEVADVYFNRTVQILRARGNRACVKAEVYLKSLPGDWGWGILAGIEEAARLL